MPKEFVLITLEDTEYKIQTPLTLGHLADLRVAMVELPSEKDAAPGELVRKGFDHILDVVSQGMIADYPKMTPEKLKEMRISQAELDDAWEKIINLAGVKRRQQVTPAAAADEAAQSPGEAAAGSSPA